MALELLPSFMVKTVAGLLLFFFPLEEQFLTTVGSRLYPSPVQLHQTLVLETTFEFI